MRVGVGLPNTIPGAHGRTLIEWARRADGGPFSSVGVLDRIAYESLEPLTSLSAAAAVTGTVRLATIVVIGPLRNTALLAKQAASVQSLSGGRLVLGLAVGARQDDYEAAGIQPRSRGRRLSEQIVALRSHWGEKATGTQAPGAARPELLVGGTSGESLARMARYSDGYVHGGGPPRAFAGAAARARAAWIDAGRPGEPVLWGQGYFALGRDAAEQGSDYLRDYYAFTGPFAEKVAAGNLTSPREVAQFVRGYRDAGCDELVLLPTVADLTQLDRLADVIG